jgi:RNA polymerase sigma factor (sigma-70 family)
VDQDRFDGLYADYHTAVLSYFLRRLPGREEAHDAAADVFVVLWRRTSDIPGGADERPWIYGVCRRILLNHERTLRRRSRLSAKLQAVPDPPSEDPESVAVDSVSAADLRRALAALSSDDQEVLRLATWERLPHAEIGTILGCTAHAVDQRIHRASKRLARRLEDKGYQRSVT